MLHSFDHLNHNLLCGIDIETTGLDAERHDIYELAIIPVNCYMKRDPERKWLNLTIRPPRPENIDWEGMHKVKNPTKVKKALVEGLDSHTAMDIFQHWFELQNLGTKRIAPLGHNYAFESRFLRAWMGHLHYESMFADYEIRDTMTIVRFMNDMCDYRDERFAYNKGSLPYLAKHLNVEHDYGQAHTALADVATTIDVYRRQMEELNKKMIFAAPV